MMRTINEIRQDNKPIVFLGSCYNIQNLVEICHSSGREVIGLVDPDYVGQSEFRGVPVLDRDTIIAQGHKYDFFVATWQHPFQNDIFKRETTKRQMFLTLMHEHQLSGASLVHGSAVVSPLAQIAQHVSIGALSIVVCNSIIHRDTNIREQCYVSHDVVVGPNCILQIKATVTSNVHIGANSYIGPGASLIPSRPLEIMHIGHNVVVHPHQLVLNSVPDNSIVSYKKGIFQPG